MRPWMLIGTKDETIARAHWARGAFDQRIGPELRLHADEEGGIDGRQGATYRAGKVEREVAMARDAREAFGDDVHFHLLHMARQEWAEFNKYVTDWELRRNFERL